MKIGELQSFLEAHEIRVIQREYERYVHKN